MVDALLVAVALVLGLRLCCTLAATRRMRAGLPGTLVLYSRLAGDATWGSFAAAILNMAAM
jgi:hypothetical protein